MSALFAKLPIPLHVTGFTDGVGYFTPPLPKLVQPNLFTRLCFINDLVVKVPSPRGKYTFRKFVKEGMTTTEDVRANEELERFKSLDQAVAKFPGFGATRKTFGDRVAHFLVVHRMQHARLRETDLVSVPETRFIVLRWAQRLPPWPYTTPAILQERVSGIGIFDMIKPKENSFLPQYSALRPRLKSKLKSLADSPISMHIDWNIRNFIWQDPTDRLYYIDSKPTTMAAKRIVDQNLRFVRNVFLA